MIPLERCMSEAIVSLFNAICFFRTRCALRSHCRVVSCPTASPPPRLPGPGGEDDGDGHLTALREGFRSARCVFWWFVLEQSNGWKALSLSLSRAVIMAGSCQGKALASKGHPCLNFMVWTLCIRCDGRGQPVCQLGARPLPPLTAME